MPKSRSSSCSGGGDLLSDGGGGGGGGLPSSSSQQPPLTPERSSERSSTTSSGERERDRDRDRERERYVNHHSSGGVKKQCEECGGASPVACRACTVCGADFFSTVDKGADSPSECSEADLADRDRGSGGERRRSERVKREKPNYYDALEFENKRKTSTTPTRSERASAGVPAERGTGTGSGSTGSGVESSSRLGLSRRERLGRSPKDKNHEEERGGGGDGSGGARVVGRRGRPSGRGSSGAPSASGRATLSWKKGGHDDEEDERNRRRRKRPRLGDHDEDGLHHMMDELTSEKGLQCRVSLAEINRKFGAVSRQPM